MKSFCLFFLFTKGFFFSFPGKLLRETENVKRIGAKIRERSSVVGFMVRYNISLSYWTD